MASTYENSLRLELIATGEAASTWGDKTNANLTAIAAAFGYATQDGFAADANATTTVADGAADPARALYFKITSSATLTATRTLTIAPNTISRVMWIENATTGSQSIAISQGSGANVTIPAGKTAVVYLDGAGAGASVVDAMASLNIDGSISAGAATFSGAVTADAVAVNTTLKTWDASTDAIQLQSGSLWNYSTSQLNLGQNEYYNGAYKYLTTGAASTYNQASGGHFFKTAVSGIADGAITWVDVLGLSATGAATFSGDVGIGGAPLANNQLLLTDAGTYSQFHMQNSTSGSGASDGFRILMDGVNTTITNHETGYMAFETQNTERLRLDANGNLGLRTSDPKSTLEVKGTFGDPATSGSAAGFISRFSQTSGVGSLDFGFGDAYSWLQSRASNNYSLNYDLALNPNGGNVGIGVSAPNEKLESSGAIRVLGTTASSRTSGTLSFNGTLFNIESRGPDVSNRGTIGFYQATSNGASAIQSMLLDASGNLGIGAIPSTHRLEVKGDNNIAKFYSDATATELKIATPTVNVIGLYTGTADDLTFGTADTERMRLDTSGNLSLYQNQELRWQWQPNDYIRGAISVDASNNMSFQTAYVERLRINGSGKMMIGQNTNATGLVTIRQDPSNHTLSFVNTAGTVYHGGFYGGGVSGLTTGYSVTASYLYLSKDTGTSRSINAAGTINASGADYAEYEQNNGLTISKGSVVGFKADGTLTLIFSEAVRFAIKSTDPAYVGGDSWGTKDAIGPEPTAPDEDAEQSVIDQYEDDLTTYKAVLEAARQLVDRIAYSGKVPVNIQGATAGDYIIAVAADDGSIDGQAVSDPDFSQYKLSVGRVNRILEDGRAEVAVIIH